jgi:hypothetical protein
MTLTDNEIQAAWDTLLVHSFDADIPMSTLLKHFLLDVNPKLLTLGGVTHCEFTDIQDVIAYIEELGIRRRCYDRHWGGGLHFSAIGLSVRPFVAARAPHLFACLSDKKNSRADILAVIDEFKWTRKKQTSRAHQKYESDKRKRTRTVRARGLSKQYDWATVK